jgi:hypothetical protein
MGENVNLDNLHRKKAKAGWHFAEPAFADIR